MAIGAIEAGGTKFVCALFSDSGELLARTRTETGRPESTMAEVNAFFGELSGTHRIDSFGVGCFGPIDVDPSGENYGRLLGTPKTAWIGYNLRSAIQSAFPVPVSIDTDVNVAALSEAEAAGEAVQSLAYVTVGTGVGVGIAIEGRILPLRRHPEIGHSYVRRSSDETARFRGVCPYHGDCLEGVASGPAMRSRWDRPAEELPADHPAWTVEADYLAQAVANLILFFAPDRIVLGGGVMQQEHLFSPIRDGAHRLLAGYVEYAADRADLDRIVVPQTLGGDAGIRGAYLIGRQLDRFRGPA